MKSFNYNNKLGGGTPSPQTLWLCHGGKDEEVADRKQDGKFHISQGNNDWYTPKMYIDSARKVMGEIQLDPATSETAQKVVQALKYFTVENCGIKSEWVAETVWMNPPYSMPEIKQFCDKVVDSSVKQYIVLTNNSSDTSWFHKLLIDCDAFCLTQGRVKFENKTGKKMATRQGQCFFYRGDNVSSFAGEFGKYGFVVSK